MKKGLSKAVSFCMMIGLLAQSLYIPAMAEEAATEIAAESDTDTSLVGTLAFAQCEEYINIRGVSKHRQRRYGKDLQQWLCNH